jgi:hypothetical protein
MNTPNYIKSLLTPNTKKPQGRKVWSIDLETVWLPFFTATNTMGDTAIPSDALGCPMRLAYDKTGAVRFSQAGRPVVRVAKELSDNVRLVRDNFTANLISYAGEVMTVHQTEYRQQVETARKAGEPIAQHDRLELSKALEAKAEAEAQAVTEAYTKAHAEAHAEANTEREAVAV